MSAKSLKEIFKSSNIDENLVLEGGFLSEQATSAINQILSKQLSKFTKKGQLKLSKGTLKLLKKLNALGVEQLYGHDLSKAIPELERELAMDSKEDGDIASLLKKFIGSEQPNKKPGSGGKRYPIMQGGRVVRWATRKEGVKMQYSLKKLFLEETLESGKELVETELQTQYTDDDKDFGSPEFETQETSVQAQSKVPETPMHDAVDDSPSLSDDEVIGALVQDNAHYGEYDNVLEDK